MYRITKEFHFSASHQLTGLEDNHPCSRLHGHNYVVELTLAKQHLNDVGFVVDYRRLERFKRFIDDELDHRHLNDVVLFNPTSERLAKWLYDKAVQLLEHGALIESVTVKETEKTSATYYGGQQVWKTQS